MSAARSGLRPAAMNLAGIVEHPESSANPYEVDIDGQPFMPVGNAGVVLGVELGDLLTSVDGDHVAPGVTIIHPEQAARHALTALSCIGNNVAVRSGAAAGATGHVIGKRGEQGRVIVSFDQQTLAKLRPGDSMSVRAFGQGASLPATAGDIQLMNLDPGMLSQLPLQFGNGLTVGVRSELPSKVCGNGVGRPAQAWDIDLSLPDDDSLGGLRFGDLVAVTDLDVRANVGYRRGWRTIGVIVHGNSKLPGHGPGWLPILTGSASSLKAEMISDHAGLTTGSLANLPASGQSETGA
jgi:hypothetical protein